jgi:hypothetical protein
VNLLNSLTVLIGWYLMRFTSTPILATVLRSTAPSVSQYMMLYPMFCASLAKLRQKNVFPVSGSPAIPRLLEFGMPPNRLPDMQAFSR